MEPLTGRVDIQPGSELLAPPSALRNCQPSFVAVLAVHDDADRALNTYAKQTTARIRAKVEKQRARLGRRDITQLWDGYWLLTLVENRATKQAHLLPDLCSD
jgi:hypothetical protein